MPPLKTIILWVVVAFVVYAVLTSPAQAADITKSIGTIISSSVSNIFAFFNNLISG